MSASDKQKLDGIASGATANAGTVTSFAFTNGAGISGTVTNPNSTPALALTLGAITPSSVAASGAVTGSNLSGTNTGDQTSVTGNAGTATKWATARTLSFTGDATGSGSVDGSANVATALTLAASGVTAGSCTACNLTIDAKGRVTAQASGSGGSAITYTEGTFTPALAFGGSSAGFTYSTQVARYTRVGRLVTVEINIVTTAKGSGSGAVTITGLPFAAASSGLLASGGLFVMSKGFTSNAGQSGVFAAALAGASSIKLYGQSNGSYVDIDNAGVGSSVELFFTLTYSI